MKRVIPLVCFTISFFAVALLLCYFSLRENLWVELPNTKITYDGVVTPNSRVFESKEGDYLVFVEPDVIGQQSGQFFVYTRLSRIGVGSHGRLFMGYAWVPSNHLESNVLSGTEKFPGRVKIDTGSLNLQLPNSHIVVCFDECVTN